MTPDSLIPIRTALETGDKKAAQALLRPLLKSQPTAELWRLAAQACTTTEKAITCLHHAIALDPFHDGANRLLFKLESAQAQKTVVEEMPSVEVLTATQEMALARLDVPTGKKARQNAEPGVPSVPGVPGVLNVVDVPLKQVRRKKKRGVVRTIVLLSLVLLAVCVSLLTMNMAGLISGPVTAVTVLTGGATPVREIEGVPINLVEDAPLLIEPSQSKALESRNVDVIEPGYEHEYTFEGRFGQDAVVYVQFMSVAANRVSRNVVVIRPDGSDATGACEQDAILQGDNNVTLTCPMDAAGEWKVRILGREGESVGAYFVGIEQIGS
ncbi:MAG: hypothetical protein ABI835_06695 [Chloroflexota bacterium]